MCSGCIEGRCRRATCARSTPKLAGRWARPAAEAEFVRRYSSTTADLRHVPLAVYLQDVAEMFRTAPAPESIACPVLAQLSRGSTFARTGRNRADRASVSARHARRHDCQHWLLTERPECASRTLVTR
jgi:hypothetical protein